jgi:quercetin 2,3-dioxygenase
MITIRKSQDRGHFDHGWLKTYHTFSFADYHDPQHMGYRNLRVINDDVVAPGQGFGMHPHRNMEIITYILEGELAHKDSAGNAETIRPGEIQRMSAGRGILHSEFNPSRETPVHLLQIWIEPNVRGIEPEYEQRPLPAGGGLVLAASPDGEGGSMKINADARVYAGKLDAGQTGAVELKLGHGWIHIARGRVRVGNVELGAGDGAALDGQSRIEITADEASEVLAFDLA